MGTITKIILIKHAVETLGYFSEQLASALLQRGYDCYFIDYDRLYESLNGLDGFAVRGQSALITFNFIGLGDEEIFRDEAGRFVWDAYEMEYLNILVDHPFYYHARLVYPLPRMKLFCVDREHVSYVERFYPQQSVSFLPLAGNGRLTFGAKEAVIPYEQRAYDVVFTANYVPLAPLAQKISMQEPEYRIFYQGILDDLLSDPLQSMDQVFERHIKEELGYVSEGELCGAMAGMAVIDLYVRTYFRGEAVRTLAECGLKVDVFGAGWEELSCKKPQNIVRHGGQVTSERCVEAVQNARISLNLMPWFKDGAHDRIFTAMLQQTVALTDDSKYLREQFADGRELKYFSLKETAALPEIASALLRDTQVLEEMAVRGRKKALASHTWQQRALALERKL